MLKLIVHYIDANNFSLNHLHESSFLNDNDLKFLEKFKVEVTKKEKAASLIFKHKYIGEYRINTHGKPIAKDKCFNISHSHGIVVFVMDQAPVGIDIEMIKDTEQKFKEYISSDEELKQIKNDEDFTDLWTNKESLVKAVGTGIDRNVKDIPGLPLNGVREYDKKEYFSITMHLRYYSITVTREGEQPFELELVEDKE